MSAPRSFAPTAAFFEHQIHAESLAGRRTNPADLDYFDRNAGPNFALKPIDTQLVLNQMKVTARNRSNPNWIHEQLERLGL